MRELYHGIRSQIKVGGQVQDEVKTKPSTSD